jgi:DNA-binding MarR family transcriptional regulator
MRAVLAIRGKPFAMHAVLQDSNSAWEHCSQDCAGETLRSSQPFAQGLGMSLDTQKWHFSKLRNSSSQLMGESERKRHASADKGMQKGSEHSGAVFMPTSEKKRSEEFAAQRSESWEIVGVFMDIFVADAAAIRAKPPRDIETALSPKLVRALLYLVQHGDVEMTVGSLADGLGVSLGWASRVADELVSIGFLNRSRNSRDRRIVQLQLSERAKEVGDQLWAAREGAVTAALSEVSPSERQAIVRFLRRFIVELDLHGSKTLTHRD